MSVFFFKVKPHESAAEHILKILNTLHLYMLVETPFVTVN